MAIEVREAKAAVQPTAVLRRRRRHRATHTREQQVAWRGAPTSGAQRHTDTREERDQVWWYAHTQLTFTSYVLLATPPKPRIRSIR